MNNHDTSTHDVSTHDCHEQHGDANENTARRRFLRGAAAAAGGVLLGAQMTALANEETPAPSTPVTSTPVTVAPTANAETQIPLPSKVLEEIGGFEIVETADEKIIVARTGATTIAACSAICTHKGGILEYDHESGQFYCTRHGARFKTSGKVAKGPAKKELQAFQTRAVLGLTPLPEEDASMQKSGVGKSLAPD